MPINAETRDLLLHDFDQALEHYRHIENERNTFFIFFLTLTSVAIGVIASLAARSGPNEVEILFTVAAALAAVVMSVGVLVYEVSIRFYMLLTGYKDISIDLRARLRVGLNGYPPDDELLVVPRVQKDWKKEYESVSSPQFMTEVITGSLIVLFGLTSLAAALSVTWISQYDIAEKVVIFISVGYTAVVGVYAIRLRWRIRDLEREHAYN